MITGTASASEISKWIRNPKSEIRNSLSRSAVFAYGTHLESLALQVRRSVCDGKRVNAYSAASRHEEEDRANFIVHRASLNFIILNLFPYTSGHLMIVPYEHTASLGSAQ